LSQNLRPQELIIVDDCSDCDVRAVVADNHVGGLRLRYHRLSPQAGAAVARNDGAVLASGDVLMFLDDDDVWEPSKIELQLRLLEFHPEVGTVYTGMLAIDERAGGRILSASRRHHSGKGWPQILFRNFMGPTSAVAMKTRLFREVGGFDPGFPALQDYDLWLRLCMRAPVLYDGEHNLRFCAISESTDRISSNVAAYEAATQLLSQKYERELRLLRPLQRKRFLAQAELLLSAKHWQQKNYARAAMLVLRAITLYPPTIGRLMMSVGNRFLWRCCGLNRQH
jgi:glycosyltransferase involved in cell wall biosynthesis